MGMVVCDIHVKKKDAGALVCWVVLDCVLTVVAVVVKRVSS